MMKLVLLEKALISKPSKLHTITIGLSTKKSLLKTSNLSKKDIDMAKCKRKT